MFSKVAILLLLLSTGIFAQDRAPVLIAEMDGNQVPMMLIKMDSKVRIAGRLAETSLTMTFFNKNDQQLSGTLYFPLPEEATVSGYALDIKGKMIDGVVVSKAAGRRIFEKIVRQRVDPGLIEWARGNTFKTRVFPIPANGRRVIKVVYVSQLNSIDNTFTLPMNFKEEINSFKLDISILDPNANPKLKSGDSKFEKADGIWKTQINHKNKILTEDIIIEIPNLNTQKKFVEKASDGNYYYLIYDNPKEKKPQPANIKSLTIAWDHSLSRKGKHDREIELLHTYLNSLPAYTKVNLLAFSNTSKLLGKFSASEAEVIINKINKRKYDGGTNFKSLEQSVNALPKSDIILLFSDGIANWSERTLNTKSSIFTFSSDSSTEASFLKFLSLSSGGQWFNLKTTPISKVATAIGKNNYMFQGAEGGVAKTSYPRIPTPINGTVIVTGKLDGNRNKIKVQYGFPEGPKTWNEYTINTENAFESDLIRRYWAQSKLSDLLIDKEENKEEIETLGKKHKLVTPYTSLIVLEDVDQYIEHNVRPPKSMPEWVKIYDLEIAKMATNEVENTNRQIKNISDIWKQRVKHFNTEFKYPESFKYKAKDKAPVGGAGNGPIDHEDSFAEADPFAGDQDAAPPASIEPGDATVESKSVEGLADGIADSSRTFSYNALGRLDAGGADDLVGGIGDIRQKAHANNASTINIKKWDPKTPYITALKKAKDKYATYLKQRQNYINSPAFYFDCAAFFYNKGDKALGEKVLSNIVELNLENAALLRIIAYRLIEEDSYDLAIKILRDVIEIREEEPQSYRDLALALDAKADFLLTQNKNAYVKKYYREALSNLEKVIKTRWDRFDQIEVIALNEYNRICKKSRLDHFDESLTQTLTDDVRIVLSWDADQTDIDLWVTEPSGEKVYYGHNKSVIGGRMSRDFTNGYGPEEYTVRKAMKGKYKIQANFYGSNQLGVTGGVTLKVDVYTNYGTSEEKHQTFSVKVKDQKEVIDLGEIKF